MIVLEFHKEKEKHLGLAEAAVGIGLMIGPVLGSLMYGFLSFMGTFMTFAGILFLNLIVVYFCVPNSLNFDNEEDSIFDETTESQDEDTKITYSMFLKNKRSAFSFISCAMICIFSNFSSSFMALVLESYGIPDYEIGYIFALPCLTFVFSSVSISYIVGKFPRRVFILFSFILAGCSLLLMGPS